MTEAQARSAQPHRVVIVGAGFGGLETTHRLAGAPVNITLIDRRNHHLFQPLLYQVATAGLSAPEIAAPLRSILRRQSNVAVLMAEVVSVDVSRRVVVLADGEMPYDYLVLAAGATHSYFGHDAWARHAPGLKSIEDALEIRRRLFVAFERAERETDASARRAWLTFLVVGGGPTGVELAGTLAEIARYTLTGEFRRIDPSQARVVLLEGTDRVLPPYPPGLSQKAQQQLEGLGVEVRPSALVTGVDEGGVWLGAERLAARTVLWAAGVAASPVGRSLGAEVDRAGRVKVEKDLTLAGRPEVFVAGDLAAFEQDGRPVPGVAPAAMQMGRHAARNIRRSLAGQPLLPFRYIDKGSLATIGRRAAVADFGRVRLWGFPAWMAWLGIHIFFLIGFRNRLVVLLDWAMAYVSYQRSARLILFEPQAASGAGFTPAERAGGLGGAPQHPPA